MKWVLTAMVLMLALEAALCKEGNGKAKGKGKGQNLDPFKVAKAERRETMGAKPRMKLRKLWLLCLIQ